MPKNFDDLDDNIEDLESSTSSDLDAATEGGAPADSSDATGDTANDVLSIVRDVVQGGGDAAAAASPADNASEGGDAPVDPAAQQDDENYSDVPFHKHPRFQHLLRRMKTSEVDAKRYQNVETFLRTNGIEAGEGQEALEIAGLLKNNPVEAWRRLKPTVQALLQVVGEILPNDLTQRVQAGELSHEAALELSRARAEAESQRRTMQFSQARQQQDQERELANALTGAAGAWEADRRVKDPHFEAKLPILQDALAGIHLREGRPRTAEGVRDQLARAYAITNARFVPPAPKPQRQQKRPVTGGQVAGNAQSEPDSILEIIRANRRQR